MDPWAALSPQSLYGAGNASHPSGGTPTALAQSRVASEHESAPPWSPDNPLFWLGGVVLVTVGLVAANATVRVGRFKASGSAGPSS